jgi:hypothetical protein
MVCMMMIDITCADISKYVMYRLRYFLDVYVMNIVVVDAMSTTTMKKMSKRTTY